MLVEEQEHFQFARRERGGDRVGHAATTTAAGTHLLEQTAGHRSRERSLPLRDAAQEVDDPLGWLALQQVARGACANRAEEVLLRPGRREDHDLAVGGSVA